jgi:hypothetical protein
MQYYYYYLFHTIYFRQQCKLLSGWLGPKAGLDDNPTCVKYYSSYMKYRILMLYVTTFDLQHYYEIATLVTMKVAVFWGYDAMYSCGNVRTFQKNLLPPSSA